MAAVSRRIAFARTGLRSFEYIEQGYPGNLETRTEKTEPRAEMRLLRKELYRLHRRELGEGVFPERGRNKEVLDIGVRDARLPGNQTVRDDGEE